MHINEALDSILADYQQLEVLRNTVGTVCALCHQYMYMYNLDGAMNHGH